MSESYKRAVETPDEKMSRELISFIDRGGYSEAELREAYYQLCGVSEQSEVSERLTALREHMDEMTKNRYPLNRLAALVGAMGQYESALPEFEQFVTEMAISEKEKSMLVSIAREVREGTLECHADNTHVATILIRDLKSPAALARILKERLGEIMQGTAGKKLSFWFEEK
jgi:predicted transcriptional regulator